jgi:4-alpha-glucanotransferase
MNAAFSAADRASGLLLHVSSLPSAYGIGDLGPAAFAWIDRLAEANQGWWQILPLGPTGYGNSPFEPVSSFALNPLLASPEKLVEEGLLSAGDCADQAFLATHVDYDAVAPFKHDLLRRAWRRFRSGARPDLGAAFDEFCEQQAAWLDDYALFETLKARQGGGSFLEWPADLVRREPGALAAARKELTETVDERRFAQFLLFRQMASLREHAREREVRLIGDLPFFVALDSADLWANQELFLLDAHGRPTFLAGVPPDYFSPLGQLWGTPMHDWQAQGATSYRWWIDRLRSLLGHVDLLRLDHFRAFAAAWHVPAGAMTAETGQWLPGPGASLFRALEESLGRLPLIAEDLGLITDDVRRLRDEFGLPGMRVLQFAFDGDPKNLMLPENYVSNLVAYTGTHDNNTTRGWYEALPANERQYVWSYLKQPVGESDRAAWELIRLAWSSAAALAILPLQDVLNLDGSARMNVPGNPAGNWRWRCSAEQLSASSFQRLRELTDESGRSGAAG